MQHGLGTRKSGGIAKFVPLSDDVSSSMASAKRPLSQCRGVMTSRMVMTVRLDRCFPITFNSPPTSADNSPSSSAALTPRFLATPFRWNDTFLLSETTSYSVSRLGEARQLLYCHPKRIRSTTSVKNDFVRAKATAFGPESQTSSVPMSVVATVDKASFRLELQDFWSNLAMARVGYG